MLTTAIAVEFLGEVNCDANVGSCGRRVRRASKFLVHGEYNDDANATIAESVNLATILVRNRKQEEARDSL